MSELQANEGSKPKIGIVAQEGAIVFTWAKTKAVLEASDADVVYFTERPTNRIPRRLANVPSGLMWRVLSRIDERLAGYDPEIYNPPSSIDLECRFERFYKQFPQAEIDKIKAQKVDILIRLGGPGIYKGAFLYSAPLGVVSIHHGDDSAFRGGPPGFWEVIKGAVECGFIVQRLTETLDGGLILARGHVKNTMSATANKMALYAKADEALADVVAHVVRTRMLPDSLPAAEVLGPIYKRPRIADMLRYIAIWRFRRP